MVDGTAVTYGVRPEHLWLSDVRGGVAAEVTVVEPTGSETQVVFSLGGQQINGVFRERIPDQPGQTLYLRPEVDNIRLFDQANGKSISQ